MIEESSNLRNTRSTRSSAGATARGLDDIRREIVRLLACTGVSGREDIARIKTLAEEYCERGKGDSKPKDFISAYFSLRLARITGEVEAERTSIARCLKFLNLRKKSKLR